MLQHLSSTVQQHLNVAAFVSVDGFVEVWDYEAGKLCKDLKVSQNSLCSASGVQRECLLICVWMRSSNAT